MEDFEVVPVGTKKIINLLSVANKATTFRRKSSIIPDNDKLYDFLIEILEVYIDREESNLRRLHE